MSVSQPIDANAIRARFITVVYNAKMATSSTWHSGNSPLSSTPVTAFVDSAANRVLGPQAEPLPSWPGNVGQITSTNVYYILHLWAIALTRHRLAELRLVRSYNLGVSFVYESAGVNLTSYNTNHTIQFPYPAIPVVGTAVTVGSIDPYLSSLLTQINSVCAQLNNATVFNSVSICHSSCHGSCHGSRGRR